MKILVVSWYFPPVNTIGAVRVGKFVRFLIERGHDVGVVAGRHWGHPETMPLGVPLARVVYANSVDVNAPPRMLGSMLKRLRRQPKAKSEAGATEETPAAPGARRSLLNRLRDFYPTLVNVPDNRVGWLPWAYSAGRRMCRDWRPDLIFASGPPFTALLVARLLGARSGVPWIAELRDRWADDPYHVGLAAWRQALDERLERSVLNSARALVTVTEPWTEFYRAKYGKPIATIYNGYDPADFAEPIAEPAPDPAAPLVIGYTGSIYPGKRDPTPLFEALRLLGPDGERFRVVFWGSDPAHVLPLAERARVRHLVEVRPAVPYKEALDLQRQSDLLLLMQWNDPREQGSCPGKFFEYIASLRPMIVLGLADGVPATIARQRAAGFCLNDPQDLADQLRVWLKEKDALGRIATLPLAAREGLSRTIQYERLEKFMDELLRQA